MPKDIYHILKAILLIIVAGIVFYLVYPKYEVINIEAPVIVRYNKITGQTEWSYISHGCNWYPIENYQEKKDDNSDDK